jgi:hypothetical protein
MTPKPKNLPYESRISCAMQHLGLAPGSVATCRVKHDTWCPMLAGRPTCRCRPTITLETPQGVFDVLHDGSVCLLASLN